MKVSVLVVTYNQQKYITQAIDSILMQEVDFDYEIIIGEDNSNDATREIVEELQKIHPERIILSLNNPEDSELDRRRGFGGKSNFAKCLQACRGKYIAILDGDDYWTDAAKLQTQVDFLDQHPDFAVSFHKTSAVNGEGIAEVVTHDQQQPEVISLEDLLVMNYVPACAVMFRRGLFGELPDWFYSVKLGDWAIHIMNAQHGKVGCINKVMSAYRLGPGMWSSLGPECQRLEMINMLDHINAHLDFKYNKQIRAVESVCYYQLAEISFRKGERMKTGNYLRKYLKVSGFTGAMRLLGTLPGSRFQP